MALDPHTIYTVAAFLIGVVITYLFCRAGQSLQAERIKNASKADLAIIEERLRNLQDRHSELTSTLVETEQKAATRQEESLRLTTELAGVQQKLKNADEKLLFASEMETRFTDTFKALSSDALKGNNQSFMELARATFEKLQQHARGDLDSRTKEIDQMLKPVKESLGKVSDQMREIEKHRISSFATLNEQIDNLKQHQLSLTNQTDKLVKALRRPNVRGRWGEIQLRRVVEMAGMVEYCDFTQQESLKSESGKLRPDLIVKLPNNKSVIIDSKAPLDAYLNSLEEADEDRRLEYLNDHARQIRTHLSKLSQKSYWESLSSTPEFVVLFLPGETFFSAALQQDPTLIEFGVAQKVILATPTTLIALLRAVAYGWKQEQLQENAREVSEIGKELYDRIRVLTGHFCDLGKGLDRAVNSYNRTVGSLESRVMVSARKFKELGAAVGDDLQELPGIETAAREPVLPDIAEPENKTTRAQNR